MLHLINNDRAYPPETVAAMTAAFDRVCQSLSPSVNANDGVRERLALIVLHHVDRGELDPARISELALRELAGIDRSANAGRFATG